MGAGGPLLREQDDGYAVCQDGRRIGTIQLYDNPCHMGNRYVRLTMERLDAGLSVELFRELRAIAGRPLQIMACSADAPLTAFLRAGGFVRKRRCYEVDAGREDYVGGRADVPLVRLRAGEPDHQRACRMMFDHYVETHRAVNPWTAGREAFCEELPEEAVCAKEGGEIVSLAFVEGGEIAYVCGTDRESFADFARALVTAMLEEHGTICFESDDCDWAAMLLRSMFKNQDETSFDTYILE